MDSKHCAQQFSFDDSPEEVSVKLLEGEVQVLEELGVRLLRVELAGGVEVHNVHLLALV